MVCCVVQTCTRRSETSNRKRDGVSFHAFPKQQNLRKEWTTFCRRAPSWQPKRTSVICSDHFDPSSFQTLANQRRLVGNAIPTILLSDCERSKIIKPESQTQQHEESRVPSTNHSPSTGHLQLTIDSQIIHLDSQMQQDQQSRLPNPVLSSTSDQIQLQMNSQIVNLESQTQQHQQIIPNPIRTSTPESTASESSAPDRQRDIKLIEANWKRKLESKNKQIKKLQDNNRYLKIRVNNLQTVCSRLKKLLTKKMVQE